MRRVLAALLFLASIAAGQQPSQPQFFHITPVRPVEEIRREALKAQPPKEQGEFRAPDLIELVKIDPTIKLDIRYATSRNFLSTPVYDEAKAFMQRPAAEAVARASQKLHKLGFGLLIYDSYRPWYVTKIFWDATPPEDHNFVADPAQGSHHNRGCAVDLTMYDLKTGQAVPMTGLYDEMSERSYPNYKGGTDEERRNRETLRAAMEAEGFTVYDYEWWHFDYKDWKRYPILNLKFDQIGAAFDEGAGLEGNPQASPDPAWKGYTGPEGSVMVKVTVAADGKVSNAAIVHSLNADADRRAMDAVKKWRFKPAKKDGKPVKADVLMQVKTQRETADQRR